MPVRQLYYTSCQHPTSGQTGFQVKAQSLGIPPSVVKMLQPLMGYRIPPEMTGQPIENHPIALRYTLLNEQTAALVCSQSNGPDELGRPGNYFAHVVLGEPHLFPLPPITYWQSPFWVKRDDSNQLELAVQETFEARVNFDFDAVWTFIQQRYRLTWLRSLLAAVVESKRKIVIVDETAHMVNWIYAVSLALPPNHRTQLSFATYHHDPASAPFTIVGTTASFQAQSSEQFVLNTQTGQISETPTSTYAEFVCDYFEASQYEREVLPLFGWLEGRSTRGALDELTSFYLATVKGSLARDWTKVLGGASIISGDIARKGDVQAQDVQDLRTAITFLGEGLDKQTDSDGVKQYTQALITLHRIDRGFSTTCGDAIERIFMAIVHQQNVQAQALHKALVALYPAELWERALNERLPDFGAQLRNAAQVNLFWQIFGTQLLFNVGNHVALRALFQPSFGVMEGFAPSDALQIPDGVAQLVGLMLAAAGEHREIVLRQAAEYQYDHANSRVFEWVYYTIVERLPVSQRVQAYWPPYWDQFEGLYRYELQRELVKQTNADGILTLLDSWLKALNPAWQRVVLHETLDFSWSRVDTQRFATHLLAQEAITAILEPQWYERLVESSLTNTTIALPDAQIAAMYAKFYAEIPLNPAHMGMIQGCLALYNRELDTRAVLDLRQRFGVIDENLYEKEIDGLFAAFFQPETHLPLIQATYSLKYREAFWGCYWDYFADLLLKHQNVAGTVQILDFWFQQSGGLIEKMPYAVPEFFAGVLDALRDLRESRSYKQVERDFEARLGQMAWYPVIQVALQKTRKGLFGGFRGS